MAINTRIIAKAVILDQDNNVLLLRRSATDDRRPGEQDYPGGGIETGEDLMAGVAREIWEEAGLSVAIDQLQLFYAATERYQNMSVTRLVFWARLDNPEVKLSFEHDEFHWVPLDKVYNQFPHPVYGGAVNYGLKHNIFHA